MLRASQGNMSQAVPMLMKAIECRVRERELFRSMRCQVACDMRIIGRDRENRPVIYMSARSQTEHLRELIPHVFLAFEVGISWTSSHMMICGMLYYVTCGYRFYQQLLLKLWRHAANTNSHGSKS